MPQEVQGFLHYMEQHRGQFYKHNTIKHLVIDSYKFFKNPYIYYRIISSCLIRCISSSSPVLVATFSLTHALMKIPTLVTLIVCTFKGVPVTASSQVDVLSRIFIFRFWDKAPRCPWWTCLKNPRAFCITFNTPQFKFANIALLTVFKTNIFRKGIPSELDLLLAQSHCHPQHYKSLHCKDPLYNGKSGHSKTYIVIINYSYIFLTSLSTQNPSVDSPQSLI